MSHVAAIRVNASCNAIVDADQVELLSAYRWHLKTSPSGRRYAQTKVAGIKTGMHRIIMGCSPGDGNEVDHENGNGLDNRRENLRLATRAQNACNYPKTARGHSQFKGVYRHPKTTKFQAICRYQRRNRYLGLFTRAEDAARAYDRAAIELHGEFARLNFPREQYQ